MLPKAVVTVVEKFTSEPSASASSFKVFNDSGAELRSVDIAVPTYVSVAYPVKLGISVSLAIPAGISESGILPSVPSVATPSATPTKLIGT